jgi:nucleoside-diphosphate-sugar epimerase
MRTLVIGGTGNISKGIVAALHARNYEVVMFNRGQHLDAPPVDVEVVHGDRKQRDDFEAKMKALRVDAVIDMISFTEEDAASALRAFRGRVAHFIHCSTVMTYGPPFAGVNMDEQTPLNGTTPYARGKQAADTLLLNACATEKFPVTIVKPSLTYGPSWRVLRQVNYENDPWLDRMRKGKPIISAGDGMNYFQFLNVRDAGVGFAGLVGKERAIGQIFNLVHPQPHTWDEWHRAAAKAMGVEAEIVHVPQDTLLAIARERFARIIDNFGYTQIFSGAKLSQIVPEFQPKVGMVEGLTEAIAWMDKHHIVPNSDGDDLEDRIIRAVRDLPRLASS